MRQKSRKAREQSKNLYISTACYSENTNLMLKELRERLDKSRNKAMTEESFWELAEDPLGIADWVIEYQKAAGRYVMKQLLCSVPKYTITEEEFNKIHPWFIKTNNEKEKEKMEAKKCERCGKLYEIQDAENYITAYMPGLPITDWNKENYSESRIRKDNTRIISVNLRGGQIVDLCPECREKLKQFFESGADEINVIKKAEE